MKISPAFAAGFVVAIPLILELILRSIRGASLVNLIRWYDVAIVALLFMSYLFVFHKSQQDDTIVSWIGWGVSGLVIVPISVMWLLSLFGPWLIVA